MPSTSPHILYAPTPWSSSPNSICFAILCLLLEQGALLNSISPRLGPPKAELKHTLDVSFFIYFTDKWMVKSLQAILKSIIFNRNCSLGDLIHKISPSANALRFYHQQIIFPAQRKRQSPDNTRMRNQIICEPFNRGGQPENRLSPVFPAQLSVWFGN